jgi:uncharacterized protein (DUF433 family)
MVIEIAIMVLCDRLFAVHFLGLNNIMIRDKKSLTMNYQDIITIEPGKRSGKPCIRGMRITVYDILEYLAGGMTEAEILEDFSELTSEDIKACLSFAAEREKKLFVASL